MRKRIVIIVSILIALAALIVFNRLASKNKAVNTYAEVKQGLFEIVVANSGELVAENSTEIWGPGYGKQVSGGGGYRGPGGGRGASMTLRQEEVKIQDIVPEGTIVRKDDYVAQLDRTFYENTLKDAVEYLKTLQDNYQMKVLDTAVVLTNLRDDIKNQHFVVEEAGITLKQSRFEPPGTIRQAEISLNKAERVLEQKRKSYDLRIAQTLSEINNQELIIDRQSKYVNELHNFIAGLTIKAPSSGMVIYQKERNGTKRKAGTMVDPFDEVIANLPDLSSMISRMYINEIEISKVKTHQKVNIKIDAFPQKTFSGTVFSIANVGEKLPNSDLKMFEVQIKIEDSDPALRPSMTTDNEIIIKSYHEAMFIPLDCVQTGTDSIPFVYEKKGIKQIVVLGESNDNYIIIEQGLEPGTLVFTETPAQPEKFRLDGENLIPLIKKDK